MFKEFRVILKDDIYSYRIYERDNLEFRLSTLGFCFTFSGEFSSSITHINRIKNNKIHNFCDWTAARFDGLCVFYFQNEMDLAMARLI